MKYSVKKIGKRTEHTRQFDSLSEFYDYITTTPTNNVFKYSKHRSKETGTEMEQFTKTKTFEEAVELFKYGWDLTAAKLHKNLKEVSRKIQSKDVKRAMFDVVGFQASVPRYLQGIPTNMINQKTVKQKQKVVTFTKDISYSQKFSISQIIDESVKALQIIKTIEAQGVRCNLNVILGCTNKNMTEVNVVKIRIKNANERLNISKLAFPLVHPSMLRRLMLRYIETSPTFTDNFYTYFYGKPMNKYYIETICKENNEHLLERVIDDVDELIANL